jgi:hypothetical protein
MENVAIAGIALGVLAIKVLSLFAVVYVAVRLAIRHERRISS